MTFWCRQFRVGELHHSLWSIDWLGRFSGPKQPAGNMLSSFLVSGLKVSTWVSQHRLRQVSPNPLCFCCFLSCLDSLEFFAYGFIAWHSHCYKQRYLALNGTPDRTMLFICSICLAKLTLAICLAGHSGCLGTSQPSQPSRNVLSCARADPNMHEKAIP